MVIARGVGLFLVLLAGCAGPPQPRPSEPLPVALAPPAPMALDAVPPASPARGAVPQRPAPVAKPPAHVATPAVKPPPVTALEPAPVARPPAPPPLDLKSLASRLKDTHAIGFFTKVALKNQVDDLVEQFRAFYEGRSQTTLAALRRPL